MTFVLSLLPSILQRALALARRRDDTSAPLYGRLFLILRLRRSCRIQVWRMRYQGRLCYFDAACSCFRRWIYGSALAVWLAEIRIKTD